MAHLAASLVASLAAWLSGVAATVRIPRRHVIPAQAGIQVRCIATELDSRLRGNDVEEVTGLRTVAASVLPVLGSHVLGLPVLF